MFDEKTHFVLGIKLQTVYDTAISIFKVQPVQKKMKVYLQKIMYYTKTGDFLF